MQAIITDVARTKHNFEQKRNNKKDRIRFHKDEWKHKNKQILLEHLEATNDTCFVLSFISRYQYLIVFQNIV